MNHTNFPPSQFFTPRSSLKRFSALVMLLISIGGNGLQGAASNQFWRIDGTSGTWTGSNWGSLVGGPFSTSWTSGNNAIFNANATVTFATTAVANITIANGFTVTVTAAGTLTPSAQAGGIGVSTIDVGTGSLLTWTGQSWTTSSGAGFIKNGAGNWDIGAQSNALNASNGGFTLNNGTVIVSGNNSFGGANSLLTINGGTIQSSGTRVYANNITLGGNFTNTGTGNATFSGTIGLGAATRTITNSTTSGSRIYSGIISGSVGSGLTFDGSGAAQTYIGNASNSFTGTISILGSEVGFASDGALGNTANTIVIDGGRLTSSTTAGAAVTAVWSSTHNIQIGDTAGTSISVQSATGDLTFNGLISNVAGKTGYWVKQGGGILRLGGSSSYTGNTAINNGILQLTTGNDRLPTGTVVSIGQTANANLGTLDLNGRNQQIAGLQSISGTNATSNTNIVTSSTAATLTITNTLDYVYSDGTQANSGIISGSISLVKQGSGKQTLGGVNTYTGSTTIIGGTMALGSTGSINNSTVINIQIGGTYDVSSVTGYALASGQTIMGKGTVTGALTIANGSTLSPGASPGTLNTGNVTFNGGGNYNWQLLNGGSTAGSGWDLLNATGTLTIAATSGSKFNLNLWSLSSISPSDTNGNAINFNNSVNQTWTIATASGGISGFSADKFAINTSATNGTNGFANSLGGGTFSLAQAGNNLNLLFTAGSTALYWSGAGTGNPGTWSSTPSGSGTNGVWAQTNTGWDSAKTANFAGTAGSVIVTSVTANKGIIFSTTGYSLSGGAINLSSTGANNVISTDTNVTATVASTLSTTAGITKGGNGTLIFTSGQSYTGGTTVSAGTMQLGDGTSNNGSVTGNIANSSLVAFANPNNQSYTGIISGGGALTKSGVGDLTLTNTNSYGGGTTITGGKLILGNASDTLSNTGAVLVNGGTLDIGANSDAVGAVTLTSGSITGSGGTLQADSFGVNNTSGTATISANLDGVGALTKTNAGSLSLIGSNTYLGGTQLNGGFTSISSDPNLGDSAGVLGINGGSLALTGTVTGARVLTIGSSGGTIANGGNNFSTSNTAALNGTLAITGSGNVALNGATTFGAPGTLNIGTGGSVTLGQSTGTITMASGGTFNGDLILNTTARLNFNDNTKTYGGTGSIKILGSALGFGSGGAAITGGALTNLNALISNVSGQTAGTITSDIVLNPSGTGYVAWTAGDITTATYTTASYLAFIGGTSGATGNGLTVNGKITGDGDLFIGNNSKTGGGGGNLTLNAANDYTGNTLISAAAATIKLGIDNALPTTTNVIFGSLSGATTPTLDLNGHNQQFASLADDTTVTGSKFLTIKNNGAADATLTINGSVTPFGTFAGKIQDGSTNKIALIKDGTNTLTLAGLNTYTGGTIINGGTLKLGGTGNILTDTGAVTIGGGTFDINAANESVGVVALNSGNIINSGVDQTRALTGSSYNVKSGTVSAVLGGSSITLTKNTDGSGSGGTVTLTGVNTYTGDTTVNAGTLKVDGSITSNTSVNNNARLVVNGILTGNLTTASGAILSGAGSITGATTINGTHNPGNSPGLQTFGDLTYNNATVNWELAGNTVAGRGINYDGINVIGILNFAGSNSFNLKFNGTGSLVSWTDMFWINDHTWSVYDVTGSTSNYSNLSLNNINWLDSNGASFSLTGGAFSLGLSGNNGVLTYSVPEPSRAVLMLFGAARLLMRRRRKVV